MTLGTVIAALSSGGVAAAVAVAGAISGAGAAIANLNKHLNDADYYFERVYF